MSTLKTKWLIQLHILLFIKMIAAHCDDTAPSVETSQGIVIGYYKTSYQGRKYAVYQGIPYAQPPVGDLRFEEPRPAADWGVLNATKTKSVCAQYIDVPPDQYGKPVTENRVDGDDDCLYLNINVPEISNKTKQMPVIFMIHGGSYQYGSGGPFSNTNIYSTDRDIIFVSINYRVGIQGFLSTEDEVLPGNLGLKDQSLALQWTYDNIGHFGGDPNKIMLVGFSAGSSSVQYHHLSPLSRGLFKASFAYSGTVFNPWGFASNASEKAKQLGAIFKCPTNDSRKMIDCLKMVPAQDLAGATKEFQYWAYMPEAPFAPIVEKAGSRPFINKSPEEIAKANEFYDVPIIFGTVSQEGCDPGAGYAPHVNVMEDLNNRWNEIAPYLLQYSYTVKREMYDEIAIASRKEYFGRQRISPAVSSELIKLLTDVHYFLGIEKGVRLQAKATKSPTYLYFYSYRATHSRSEELSHTDIDYGVCHCDDLLLVFDESKPYKKNPIEMDMVEFFLNLLDTFINEGKPNLDVEWEPVNPTDSAIQYLHISNPYNYKMSKESNFGNKKFWRQFFDLDV